MTKVQTKSSNLTEKLDKDNNKLFTIHEFDIKKDTLYEITEKIDASAPDGFKDWGTSKILSSEVFDHYPGAVYDSNRNVWDTGLYETSSSFLQTFPPAVRTAVLKSLKTNIVDKMEEENGEGILDHTKANNEYWDKFQIKVTRGELFDTAKPLQLLKLYLLLVHKRVTPKPLEHHPEFRNSMYCIVDKDAVLSRDSENALAEMKANGAFSVLLQNDKRNLVQVLNYVGISATDASTDAAITLAFANWLKNKDDKYQNTKIFLDVVDKFNSEAGQEEIQIHAELKRLYAKGKVKVKSGEVWINDVYISNNYKNAAREIQTNPEFKELFATLLD